MIGDTELNRKTEPPRRAGKWKPALMRAKKIVTRHWMGKLACLLAAIFVWGYLVGQDGTLMRDKVFRNVAVSVVNADALLRSGFIVMEGLENLTIDRVTVSVPQKYYDAVTASNYNLRVDLARIRSAGTQDVPVLFTTSTAYGGVTSMSSAALSVTVEEYISVYRVPVQLKAEGEAPADTYLGTLSVSPSEVTVSGPKSLVERVARLEASFPLPSVSGQTGQVLSAVPFVLTDAYGNPVTGDQLNVMTSQGVALTTVTAEQTVYLRKELAVSELDAVTGTPAKGYEVKSVTFSPDVIAVGGTREALDQYDAAYLAASVDVSGASAPLRRVLSIVKPDGLQLSERTVVAVVDVGPIIVSRLFEGLTVHAENVGEGLKAELSAKKSTALVSGPMLTVNALKAAQIALSLNLEGLPAGSYTIPIVCTIDSDVELDTETLAVDVTISAK